MPAESFPSGQLFYFAEWLIRLVALVVVPYRRPFTATAWLLLLFFLPVPGLLLFLAIGEPRFPKWRAEQSRKLRPFQHGLAASLVADRAPANAVAKLAERLGYLPAVGGNSIELIGDYDGLVERLIADIDSAKRNISILVYIFADDAIGRSVSAALARAVRRGVNCKVLIDSFGSSKWMKGTLQLLEQAQVDTHQALPMRRLRRRTRRDMRNHRKLFVIDDEIGYAGSQNIVAKDFRCGVVNRELVARCTGPIVAEISALCWSDWFVETGSTLPDQLIVPDPTGEAVLQLLPSGPDYPKQGFETLLVWQLHMARRRVVIVTPYFVPGQSLLAAMETASIRGVRVDLVLSRIVDQRLVNLAQRSYYQELLRAGVRIHLYGEYLLHAKTVSIDDELGILGSSNVDLRSFELNEEVSLLLFDRASIEALRSAQDKYIERSGELHMESWKGRGPAVRLAESLARLVSPLL